MSFSTICTPDIIIEVTPTGPPGPPGPAGSPGNGVFVVGEVPAGLVNGSNATFTTAFGFVPESVEVYVNGLRQKKPTDFNTAGTTTILFSDSPLVGDLLLANYLRN